MTDSAGSIRTIAARRAGVVALVAVALSFGCASHDATGGAGAAGKSASVSEGGAGGAQALGTGGSSGGMSTGAAGAAASSSGGVTSTGGSAGAGGTSGAVNQSGAPGTGGMGSANGGRSGAGGRFSRGTGGVTGVAGAIASAGSDTGGQPGAAGAAATGTPTLYWLDVSGKVMRSDVAQFAAKTLVSSAGQGSDGIAVDVAAGYIYWTDMGVPADNDGSLMRSDLDGSNVKTLIAAGGIYTPKQLKLEPIEQKLYWSDREGMRVMRANYDGSNVETLYTSGVSDTDRQDMSRWCVGIALDVAGGYFYWSQKGPDDGQAGSLRRAHLAMPDGDTDKTRSDVEVLYDGLAAPIDLDLDLGAGLIYWTNRGDNTVNRGPIELPSGATAVTRTDRQIIVPNVNQAIGIALDHERGLVYYTDAVGDVGRANLDGSSSKFLLTKSGAFTGIVSVDLPN